jgi:hypothetical protein
MSGVGVHRDPCTATIFWSIVFTIYFIPPIVPYLWQSRVSYTTESHHSCLVYLSYEMWIQLKLSLFLSCRFLVIHISQTRTGELNSHHQQSPIWVEDIGLHTTGCCPVPRRDRLPHCYHRLSAMQISERCLTPWLLWTRRMFAVIEHYPPPRRGQLGLDFGGDF